MWICVDMFGGENLYTAYTQGAMYVANMFHTVISACIHCDFIGYPQIFGYVITIIS